MADTGTPTTSLSATAEAEAIAPSSLRGWSTFQRQINVTLPYRLTTSLALLQSARVTLGGRSG